MKEKDYEIGSDGEIRFQEATNIVVTVSKSYVYMMSIIGLLLVLSSWRGISDAILYTFPALLLYVIIPFSAALSEYTGTSRQKLGLFLMQVAAPAMYWPGILLYYVAGWPSGVGFLIIYGVGGFLWFKGKSMF
ncbi:MAG: hypothetical protein ACM3QZ_01940 [Solirubrobacterales bacterium]